MTKLKGLKQLNNIFSKHITELETDFQEHLYKIKEEYNSNLINEKIKLLLEICNGENLNFEMIKKKYLNARHINKYLIDNISDDNQLLDKIIINDIEYYYENKLNGNIYDNKSKIVGFFMNNEFIINGKSVMTLID
jgi:hypothetical protein